MRVYLRTERLIIASLTLERARDTHLLSLDADNRRYLPDEVFATEAAARRAIRMLRACYDGNAGPQVFGVALADGTPIGHVEAAPIAGGWEVGYHIGSAYTGRGYASEAVRAFLPAALDALNVSRLYGICAAENAASRRVLEKCGFALEYAGMGAYQGAERRIARYVYARM